MARKAFTRGGAKRTAIWLAVNIPNTAIVGTSTTLLGVLNAAGLLLRPFTIVRTRLRIFVESDQIVATELTQGAFGLIVVSDQATASGAVAVPSPISQADAAFFSWEAFHNQFLFGDSTGFQESAGTVIEVDSKAMRKVGVNDDIAMLGQTATSPGANASIIGRIFVKLH